jgi:PAS domain S-box-containing protein
MTEIKEWRVLVIDDDEDVGGMIAFSLRDAGCVVQIAHDGPGGLAMVPAFAPHIVITDVRMPGMDGIQVLAHLKQDHPHIEVVVATAFAEMAPAVRALQLGASDFITKPIHHDALTVALERARQRCRTRIQLEDYTRFLEEGWNETTRELMETFAYQNRLIESSMDGILGVDDKDIVVIFNNSMQHLLGYSQNETIRQMALDRFFAPDVFSRFRDHLAADAHGGPGRLLLYETTMISWKGEAIPVQLSATTMTSDDRPLGLVCFARDLRKLRRLELQMADQARILHQDKMVSLGALAASVAHEINNPLSGVLNYIRLMLRISGGEALSDDQAAKFHRYLETAEKEVTRCSRIVSNLLAFSRKSSLAFAPVQITELMERCIELSRHRLEMNNIELITDLPENLPLVTGDSGQLQQCMINLLFNALDAMPGGGRLSLSAGKSDGGREVFMKVKDNGCGIPDQDKTHIFDPFFTTKQEGRGTGLGLSTTYAIIERHGGSIDMQSRVGQGTTFVIRLPADQARVV